MNYNPYLYEKLVQAHQQELLHEAEQQRLLAHLPHHSPSMLATFVSRLRAFLLRPASAKPAELPARTVTGQL
jgi:hypothetical protein